VAHFTFPEAPEVPEKKPSPGLTAKTDQLGAALRALAPALAEYYAELRAQGLPDEIAHGLCVDYQRWLLDGGAAKE
jgi:hypothetical protein